MRIWILIAILCILTSVWATYRYLKDRTEAARQAHWNQVIERGDSFVAVNGAPAPASMFAATDDFASPVAVRVPGPAAEFRRVELPWSDSQGASGLLKQIDGCLPLGEGRDLLWKGGELFLARSSDGARRVWAADEPGSEFGRRAAACFDGRYAWARLGRASRSPRLLVVDPQSEQVWQYTSPDGSLSAAPDLADEVGGAFDLAVTPVSPGKVCAIVKPRSYPAAVAEEPAKARPPAPASRANAFWVGTFEFEAPDRRSAAPIPVPDKLDLFTWPVETYTLEHDSRTKVVVSRGARYSRLIIDPHQRRIDLAKLPLAGDFMPSLTAVQVAGHDGALWWMKSLRTFALGADDASILGTPALVRAALPDLAEGVALRKAPVGILVARRGSLYIIGERCWRLRGSGPEVEEIASEPPWQFDDFLNSNGIVTRTRGNTGPDISFSETYTISEPPPPPGRDPFLARLAFASEVFGFLISASQPAPEGEPSQAPEEILYQFKVLSD
ncbi:MAG TPA: hypothetical protein VG826_35465 [Pirellulales bacterium]|nr:hypothetical protein [Pirellulales bacterium]